MSSNIFYQNTGPYKITEIAEKTGCVISNLAQDFLVKDIKTLSSAERFDLSVLNNKKYINEFRQTKAGACIVSLDFEAEDSNVILLRAEDPYYAYALAVDLFYRPAKEFIPAISKSAYVSPSAKIGKNCYIGRNVVIGDEVEIGDDCVIEAASVIDFRVKIGDNARIDSNVTISHAIIGNNCVILPGARIGQDGFGFSSYKGIHKKIYHIGRVIIGNDVEIGANSCIDRGSSTDTIIEDLCRIDNLVQIGHNVHIKKGAIIVAQVGIAGSSVIGSYCALGGQVGIAGHITIADKVQLAGQSGVIQDIKSPGIMGGTPAVPIKDWHRQTIMMKKLIEGAKK